MGLGAIGPSIGESIHSMASWDSKKFGDMVREIQRKGDLVPALRSLSYCGKDGVVTQHS